MFTEGIAGGNHPQRCPVRPRQPLLTQVQRIPLPLIHASLASTEHQRFDYDLGVGVGLTHLPHAEVRQALEQRWIAIQAQAHRAAEACEWWKSNIGA
ncbi:MAG: hypothetical protein ABI947_16580 [Chloroflexota bacterium]